MTGITTYFWRIRVEIKNILEEEDREVFITLSRTYLEWKEATKREGLERGRQEGKLEAKLESIPRLLALGLNVEQIAEALALDLEQVRQVARE
ncbi:hypothetical protein V0288_13950 [Pannus brasiliensis CCIBt3594]|uniref:Rpn family recombination-promoting nuclease/putative transposase n=1 Tax=Pannus brasiliensis CCIBt3594 TaxID=1427578 RepID=A0AAW9QWY8_9CHRO